MYFLKVINSLPEKLSKYNTFIFFSIQGAYEKNPLYKSKVRLFSSAFNALTKKTICTKVKYIYFLQHLRHLQKKTICTKVKYIYFLQCLRH